MREQARRRLRAAVGALAALVLLVGGLVQLGPGQPAAAVSAWDFNAGRIIDDDVFYNKSTMNVDQIQAFLNFKVPNCRAGYTCLKDFREDTRTIGATPMCGTYQGAAAETAATIIYKVAQACGINPQVLIVMLQKEQGLVTGTAPSSRNYRSAMGAGCPDTADCDAAYYGFFNQVHYAAYLLKRYTQPPGTGAGTAYTTRFDLMYPVQQWSNIQYNPNGGCGTQRVFVQNQATHSLYVYTPYVPNNAALAAGYGIGDGCSAYGNRNFFLYFSDWFGSPYSLAPSAIQAKWESVGGAGGILGAALGDVRYVTGGAVRDFQRGRIHFSPATGAQVVLAGPIGSRYDALTGESGPLGFPVGGERAVTGGVVQDFQKGRIHFKSDTGAWAVIGAISKRYDATRGESGVLGFPVGAAENVAGGTVQAFERGRIFVDSASGVAAEVHGAIGTAYAAAGSDSGPLGLPVSPPRAVAGGTVQDFKRGRIHAGDSTGAQVVLAGAIGSRYDELRGESGVLGFPIAAQQSLADGASQAFQNGLIVSSPLGAVELLNPVASAYTANSGDLGWPLGPARTVAGGSVQDFERGRIHHSAETGAQVVLAGEIGRRYDALNGESGVLGYPTKPVQPIAGGSLQEFQNGVIVASAHGTSEILGAIATKYLASQSALGLPLGGSRAVAGGTVQDFEYGRIHRRTGDKPYVVLRSSIGSRYDSLLGESGRLGYPVGDARSVAGGLVQDFQFGRIHYSAATSAWEVVAPISAQYDALHGESGVLGYPKASQRAAGGGWVQDFQHGRIHASGSGAWAVYGPFAAVYDSLQGESGVLGFPLAGQRAVPGGLVQDFRKGRIHYSAGTGAWAVYGAIGARYDSLRGESGVLGYPIRDRYPYMGGLRQDFQHGWIHVSASGAVTHGG